MPEGSTATLRAHPLSRILALLVLSTLVPAALLTGALVWRTGVLDRDRANQQALQFARNVTVDIDRELDSSIETLVALASSPALERGDLETFYRQAVEAMQFRRLHVLVKSLDGQQLLNTRVPFGTEFAPQPLRPFNRQAIESRQPVVSDLFVGEVSKQWIIDLNVPVQRNGDLVYLLSMSISPEYFRKLLEDIPVGPEWIIAVSDRSGRLIARSREHAEYLGREMHPDVKAWSAGPEGVHRTPSLAGDEVVRGYKWSTKSGWLIAAFVPATVIDAPIGRLWRMFSVFAIGLVGIVVPLTYSLSRQIAQPIALAAQSAARLGRGEVVEHTPTRLQEANVLSAALAKASRNLGERQRALAENELRYRSVFEQSAVGFVQVGLEGKLIDLNDRLCKMLGFTRAECLEKTFQVLTHPDDWAAEDGLIGALVKGDKPFYELEKRMLTKSGAPMWVRVTSAVVRDSDGKALYRTSVVEDVTERRKAREAAARLAAIVQASQDAIISISLAGDIETWNPGAEKLFGYVAEEVIGNSLKIITPHARSTEFDTNLAAVGSGTTLHIEARWKHKDDTAIDVSLTATPIKTGDTITSISITVDDIRERKRRERHITLLNRELAHRVKNTLAVVQSIANQTMRSTPDPKAFRMSFQGRLQALAAANDLLLQTSWGGAELKDFIDRQLAPLMPRSSMQLRKDGPSVVIPAALSVHLGLALHELGTNAIKYGAWSVPGGQVHLTWELVQASDSESRRLALTWTERGGPPVSAPMHSGFGTTLIERGIPDAKVERRFLPEGLVCKIDLTLPDARQAYEG